jgi:DNA-binding HxlR family transcriptional regulator
MEVLSLEQKPGCIKTALTIFGDKWTPLLVRDLYAKPCTFSELEENLSGISPRTLSQRLSKLEENGIIVKTMYCERPPRHNYSLTKKGEELHTILQAMADWGAKYYVNNC